MKTLVISPGKSRSLEVAVVFQLFCFIDRNNEEDKQSLISFVSFSISLLYRSLKMGVGQGINY